jgi:glucose/arabinose dehydrogenase
MWVNVRPLFAVALVLAACAAPNQPTPTPTATARATGSPGCGPDLPAPTPTDAPSPGCTQTPPPASTSPAATSSATPNASLSGELNLAFKVYVEGFDALTFAGNAGDGTNRLFALEQVGRIRIVAADGTVAAQPFLDVTDRIASGGERGLLGLAFHPDYAANGRFYVDYTDLNGDTVVSEFTRTGDTTADPASERVIFTVDQPFANHNGGMLAFGPDGALYVGMGDGGSGGDPNGNGQNDATLLGKLVRVDVDASGDAGQPGIWDKGLRNPWRFSFDRATGDLWIGDVGQALHEEIDAEPAASGGRNYGWNIMEGNACFATTDCDRTGLTLPVATYDHGTENCSVTGGYVYRGSAMPELVGQYLYADYCSGNVWALDAAAALAGAGPAPQRVGNVGTGITSFGEDEAGELYLVSKGGRIISISRAP